MLKIKSKITIGKIPDYHGKQFGKIQLSSQDIASLIGKKVDVIVYVLEDNEFLIHERFDPMNKVCSMEWKNYEI